MIKIDNSLQVIYSVWILGILTIMSLPFASSSPAWEDDLLLCYDFNDSDESVSHVHNLSINQGSANYTTIGALIGKSGRFTDDNTLKINSTSLTNLGNYSSTLNFFVYVDDIGTAIDVLLNIENGIVMNSQAHNLGYLYTSGIITGAAKTSPNLLQQTWFMITYVHNGTDGSIYVNGTLYHTGAKGIGTADSDVLIGAHSSGSGYDLVGYIDEMSWHNRSLSQAEITERWNNGIGMTCLPVADTCTCPGAGNDWEIDMSDYCNITTACDLTTGTLSFTGAGWCNCNASVDTTNLGDPGASGVLYIQDSCLITID